MNLSGLTSFTSLVSLIFCTFKTPRPREVHQPTPSHAGGGGAVASAPSSVGSVGNLEALWLGLGTEAPSERLGGLLLVGPSQDLDT